MLPLAETAMSRRIKTRPEPPAGSSPPATRAELEAYGRVWDTRQLAREFVLLSALPGRVVVRRKADGREGTLSYQDGPRLYFGFVSA